MEPWSPRAGALLERSYTIVPGILQQHILVVSHGVLPGRLFDLLRGTQVVEDALDGVVISRERVLRGHVLELRRHLGNGIPGIDEAIGAGEGHAEVPAEFLVSDAR